MMLSLLYALYYFNTTIPPISNLLKKSKIFYSFPPHFALYLTSDPDLVQYSGTIRIRIHHTAEVRLPVYQSFKARKLLKVCKW